MSIAQLRLAYQGISSSRHQSVQEVVTWLGALQAQDYAGAKWSLGLRLADGRDEQIEAAIQARQIVRTWPMRGTLHFVAATDVRWMLKLMTPRIVQNSKKRRQQLEIDDDLLLRTQNLFSQALQGGQVLSREALMTLLEAEGISTQGQRGYHLLWWCAQQGLICFGPIQGKQQTFVLLEDWLPADTRQLSRDEALCEIASRYFSSHGPASLKDLIWWTGLTAKDARAGLNFASEALIEEKVAATSYWRSSDSASEASFAPGQTRLHLLPGFDEYLLGYTDRSAVLAPEHAQKICPGSNGMFSPTLVIDGQVTGTWKRSLKKTTVSLQISPFRPLSPSEQQALIPAAERYGRFLGLRAELA
jgi:hypothetical protein